MKSSDAVSIVILSSNERLVHRLLESLFRTNSEAVTCSIHIVDDGLNRSFLSDKGYGVEYVNGRKPFCFAMNANLGIAQTDSSTDVLLLNDDTCFVTANAVAELASAAAANPDLGLLTPTFTSREMNPRQRVVALPYSRDPWREWDLPLTFPAVYLTRRMLEDVGQFDEAFVGYGYEDYDYCIRAWKRGYSTGILPSAVMIHGDRPEGAHSTYRHTKNMQQIFGENRVRFLNKWGAQLLGLEPDGCTILHTLLRWTFGIPGTESNPSALAATFRQVDSISSISRGSRPGDSSHALGHSNV